MLHQTVRGKSLNTSYAGCDTCLRKDLEVSDGACICYMGTTAKLCGEISHLYNAYLFAVLLTKQCHSTGLLCFIYSHNFCYNRKRSLDLFIYNILYLFDLLWSHSREMGKIKTETSCIYIGTSLFYMAS